MSHNPYQVWRRLCVIVEAAMTHAVILQVSALLLLRRLPRIMTLSARAAAAPKENSSTLEK